MTLLKTIARRHVPIIAGFILGLADVIATGPDNLRALIPPVVAYVVEWFTSPAATPGRPTL